MHKIILLLLALTIVSCVSTKSTIKNIDENAPVPKLSTDDYFIITEFSTDKKYGYDADYPINIFYRNTANDSINQKRFLNALTGPKGEKISFKKIDTCCPFPTIHSPVGAGFLDVFEVTWAGQKSPILLYLNIYEKGYLKVPVGLGLKQ